MKFLFVLINVIFAASILDVGAATADPCQSHSSDDSDSYWYVCTLDLFLRTSGANQSFSFSDSGLLSVVAMSVTLLTAVDTVCHH